LEQEHPPRCYEIEELCSETLLRPAEIAIEAGGGVGSSVATLALQATAVFWGAVISLKHRVLYRLHLPGPVEFDCYPRGLAMSRAS
jgi:hypothetical protein